MRPPELLERKVGFVARLIPGRTDRTTPLDVVAEIEWASARRITPEHLRRRPPPGPGDGPRLAWARVADDLRAVHRARSGAAGWSTSTTSSAWRRATWPRTRCTPRPVGGGSATCSSTSSRTSTPSSSSCCRPGWARTRTSASWATPTRPSTPGTAPTPATSRTSTTSSPAARRWSWRTTTARRPRCWPWPTRVLAGRPPTCPSGSGPTGPTGPCPPCGRCADETAEARAIARAARDPHRPGRAVVGPGRAGAHQRAGRPHGRGVHGGVGPPPGPRWRPTSWNSRRSATRSTAIRNSVSLEVALTDLETEVMAQQPQTVDLTDAGPATSDRRTPPGPRRAPGPHPRTRSRTRTTGPRLTDERLANLAELVRLGREYLDLDPGAGVPGLPGLAQLHPAQRGPRRRQRRGDRHLPRGQGPGVVRWCTSPASRRATCPSTTPRREDDLDEERRLLYVALTRARDELHCTWAPQARLRLTLHEPLAVAVAGRPSRRPSGWRRARCDRNGAAPDRPTRPGPRCRAGSRSAPADGPTGSCSRRCGAGARTRPRRPTSPPSSSSTTPPWSRSPQRRPASRAELLRRLGHRPGQGSALRRRPAPDRRRGRRRLTAADAPRPPADAARSRTATGSVGGPGPQVPGRQQRAELLRGRRR